MLRRAQARRGGGEQNAREDGDERKTQADAQDEETKHGEEENENHLTVGEEKEEEIVASPGKYGLAFILNGRNQASDDSVLGNPLWALWAEDTPLWPEADAGTHSRRKQRSVDTEDGEDGVCDEEQKRSLSSSSSPSMVATSALSKRARPLVDASAAPLVATCSSSSFSLPADATTTLPMQSKKRGRMCKADGCENYIVQRGLCCRHGGGKKCSFEGCETSAKHMGLCWKHGGSVECKMPDCTKRAKAKGLCWAHGGGTKCNHATCDKVAVSNGSCWAHGGGKRCIYDGCQKPSYERTHNFCVKHYNEMQDVDYYEV